MEDYPKLTGGLIGYFGYDMIRQVEKKDVYKRQIPKDIECQQQNLQRNMGQKQKDMM